MVTNYQRGRAKEYRVKKKLEQQGYYVIRSAGSHSYFDLIAIHKEKREILLIQVKKRATKKDRELYEKLAKEFDGKYDVAVVLFG